MNTCVCLVSECGSSSLSIVFMFISCLISKIQVGAQATYLKVLVKFLYEITIVINGIATLFVLPIIRFPILPITR